MIIFRSKPILDFYESSPAVHYIPSSNNAGAFGDAVSIGAKISGSLSFEGNLKMIKKLFK